MGALIPTSLLAGGALARFAARVAVATSAVVPSSSSSVQSIVRIVVAPLGARPRTWGTDRRARAGARVAAGERPCAGRFAGGVEEDTSADFWRVIFIFMRCIILSLLLFGCIRVASPKSLHMRHKTVFARVRARVRTVAVPLTARRRTLNQERRHIGGVARNLLAVAARKANKFLLQAVPVEGQAFKVVLVAADTGNKHAASTKSICLDEARPTHGIALFNAHVVAGALLFARVHFAAACCTWRESRIRPTNGKVRRKRGHRLSYDRREPRIHR